MNITNKKNSEIKMRISKTDKEILLRKAKEHNTTLTHYILEKCLNRKEHCIPPEILIMIYESYNEIIHYINDTGDIQLTDSIKLIIKNYMSKIDKEIL